MTGISVLDIIEQYIKGGTLPDKETALHLIATIRTLKAQLSVEQERVADLCQQIVLHNDEITEAQSFQADLCVQITELNAQLAELPPLNCDLEQTVEMQAREIAALKAQLEAERAENAWQSLGTMPNDRIESESFEILWENDMNDMVALQVSWFEGGLYPDHLGGSIDWNDRVTEHYTHWRPCREVPRIPGRIPK